MSYVTDVTMILTDWHDKQRFERLVEEHAGFTPAAAEPRGPNCTGNATYALGLDYAKRELLDAILAGPWSSGSVAFIWCEACRRPQIKVFGPAPAGGWADEPEIAS